MKDPFNGTRSLVANVDLNVDTIDAVESQILEKLPSRPELTFRYGGKIIKNTKVLREYGIQRHSTLFSSFTRLS